jgi:hypothetical protein
MSQVRRGQSNQTIISLLQQLSFGGIGPQLFQQGFQLSVLKFLSSLLIHQKITSVLDFNTGRMTPPLFDLKVNKSVFLRVQRG